jgi:hypothetical protein
VIDRDDARVRARGIRQEGEMVAVNYVIPDQELELSREEHAVVFRVRNEDGLIGELKISKGGLRWYPKASKYHHFRSWERFADLMEEHAPKVP